MLNKNKTGGVANPSNPYWTGPKVIKTSADVMALAERWKNALVSGWNPPNNESSVDSTAVLAQYAPDYLASFKTKTNSGLGLGSQLLATLDPTPLTTDDLRAGYFQDFLADGPTPFFDPTMIYRKLSKVRGCAVHYGSSLPLSKTHYHYPCVCMSEMKT